MLGVVPEVKYAEEEIVLARGDRLCLFTDGVSDAQDAAGNQFGPERLPELLRESSQLDAGEMVRRIVAELDAFRSDRPPADDITVLVAQML